MEWWEMMGQSPMPPAQPETGGNLTQALNPDPMGEILQYNRPAANPQELEKRTTGWAQLVQRFEQNPNLQRALFMTGAMMAQPIRPGQTPLGNVANAGVVGLNAYTAGQAAELEQMSKRARDAREERRLGIEERKAGPQIRAIEAGAEHVEGQTATETARRPGVEAEAQQKVRTLDDAIASSRANRQKLELSVDQAEKDAALRELTRANEALRANAQGPNITRQVQQEMDLNDAKLKQIQEQTSYQAAHGRQAAAKAGIDEMTTEIVRALPPDEQKDFALKRGKYGSTSQSAVVQQRDMYGELYDQLPGDDPLKKQMSKEQFVLRQLQSGKQSSALKELTDYVTKMEGANLTPDPQIVEMWTKAAKLSGQSMAQAPAGSPAPGGPAPAPAETKGGRKVTGKIATPTGKSQSDPVAIAGQDDFDKLESGTYFKGPDGKVRRKP